MLQRERHHHLHAESDYNSTDNSGTDSFVYTVSDGNGGTATATVTIEVTAVDDVVDPIILDLGATGLTFAAIHDGVSFDINGDGHSDLVG